jgi:Zn-finger nucleic acid-binding protein
MKATDQWGTPLCPRCHLALEMIGSRREVEWFGRFGIDPHALARDLWLASGDLETMTAIAARHIMTGRGLI